MNDCFFRCGNGDLHAQASAILGHATAGGSSGNRLTHVDDCGDGGGGEGGGGGGGGDEGSDDAGDGGEGGGSICGEDGGEEGHATARGSCSSNGLFHEFNRGNGLTDDGGCGGGGGASVSTASFDASVSAVPFATAFGDTGGGDGTLPRRIGALRDCRVVAVSAGEDHALAATSEGHLYSWGHGGGFLGRPSMSDGSAGVPMVVAPFGASAAETGSDRLKVVAVAAGSFHSLAATAVGEVNYSRLSPSLSLSLYIYIYIYIYLFI